MLFRVEWPFHAIEKTPASATQLFTKRCQLAPAGERARDEYGGSVKGTDSSVAFEEIVKLREIVMENIQFSEQLRSSFFTVPDFMNVGSGDLLHEA